MKPIAYTAIVLLFCWGLYELLEPFVQWAVYWAPVGGPICRDGRCG